MKRLILLPVCLLVMGFIAGFGSSGTAAAAGQLQLNYQIKDARGYAYKASIPEQVIKVAPKCDPKTDKYHCDSYITKPNCPPKIDIGPEGTPPPIKPPAGADGISGGAGDNAGEGNSSDVPQSSAVRLNRLLSLGALGRVGNILQANGLASKQYVELGAPPWDPTAHTETDAFTNQDNYEERCIPEDQVKDGRYTHLFSHSFDSPQTWHFSECFEDECQFNGGPLTPTAEHGVSEVHLYEVGGIVHGEIIALLEGFDLGGGAFTVDELQSYVSFESDGTAAGLKWKVVTTSDGAKLGGQPVAIPQGSAIVLGIGDESVSIGMAGPSVTTDKKGSLLTVVAPGMFVATDQQTAFFAGAEVTANFGQSPVVNYGLPPKPPPPPSGNPTTSSNGPTTSGVPYGTGPGLPAGPTGTGGTNQPIQATEQLAILSRHDPPWAPATIIAIGVLGLLLVFLRWVQQFEWGRRMYEVQPMRSFEWLYRTFVKT